jgi:transcription antitermination factor NusG
MGLTERELCATGRNTRSETFPWLALTIRPQHERAVHDGLRQKGLESFLPMYWTTRRWSDRVKRLQLPLFPGYVFCRFDFARRLPVLQTPGVRSVVSFGSEVVPIPDTDLERIQQMIDTGFPVEPLPYLQAGQRVRVNQGPLAGLEGTLSEVRNRWRVVVGLDLLQRSVAVQLDRSHITPCPFSEGRAAICAPTHLRAKSATH